MGLLSRLFGRDEDQVEYTVDDEGVDYDIEDGDMVDTATGEVYYENDEEDDPDEYVEDGNSNGFYDYQAQFEQQGAVCGGCGHYQQFDQYGNVFCGCPEDVDDFD